ncbi:YidC/Oxa1 family membrane protein insertase [Sellimonas caecigallum]|uniref:YidC/Oxa1 family membrane protein insertase n=1 Tax=Sellimonas caecigallum TaxID=2592333 RepID=A0ABS7L6V2_9FIRM|nr:YidC/Oxa1 family membrane protein insertase [Sellimonas caecigallum]MBY0758697.1 YidC/Oxa1 family membrane protein insertase [Sellimonas caecigallum]
MEGLLLTQSSAPIVGQISWLLGHLMNGIFNVLSNVFHIENIGLCIIIFTIIIYTLLLPLTYKQQKASRLTSVMSPELQRIQNKYKGKKDQASMMKMQEETKMVYEKYGTSMMGGCSQLLIQLPIIWGLFYVIRNIPAYVSGIKDVYMPLVGKILETDGGQAAMEAIGKSREIMMDPSRFDFSKENIIVDALYKFQESTWDKLADKLPDLETLIHSTQEGLAHLNSFIGINIAETPLTIFMDSIKTGAIATAILALSIPLISGITQYMSMKMTPTATTNSKDNKDNPMMASMNTTMKIMPLFSVFMVFTFPSGIGLYWIASAVVRMVQQYVINKHLEKISIEELIEKNQEKAAKKREKKGTNAKKLSEMAQVNARRIEEPKRRTMTEQEREEVLKKAQEKNKNAKQGSLASKANLVKQFNENNRKDSEKK